jgi:hypothetical protein
MDDAAGNNDKAGGNDEAEHGLSERHDR